MKKIRALALVSGGLDSLLAAKVIETQGIEVQGISFQIGFTKEEFGIPQRDKNKKGDDNGGHLNPQYYADKAGIKLNIENIFEEFKSVLVNPKHGYGSNMNPCIDCKAFMLHKAKEYMEKHGFDFLVTGEVLGQRPMSQRKQALPIVAKEGGVEDIVLRPLCAKLLPETLPERNGWVDREKLYDFNGRGRKSQVELAKQLGVTEYPQPAGGCLLTDPGFSKRLENLWQSKCEKEYSVDEIKLLSIGRHLRFCDQFKLIISREKAETEYMEQFYGQFTMLKALDYGGPVGLIDGDADQKEVKKAAAILARYGSGRDAPEVKVEVFEVSGEKMVYTVVPYSAEQISPSWHI